MSAAVRGADSAKPGAASASISAADAADMRSLAPGKIFHGLFCWGGAFCRSRDGSRNSNRFWVDKYRYYAHPASVISDTRSADVNTATYWPDWLSRLDRVVMDSDRLLGRIPGLTAINFPVIEETKRRLMSLPGELKLLNRNVIGGHSRRTSDLIQDLQAALETAVLHIEKAVTDYLGAADFMRNHRSLDPIRSALVNIEYRANMLVLPVKLPA
jgi:hypothetical protein